MTSTTDNCPLRDTCRQSLNRRAAVEQEMLDIANGKAPLPDEPKLREWIKKLGVPEGWDRQPGGPLPRVSCDARQHSDEMVCERCSRRWDVNDAAPPNCSTFAPGDAVRSPAGVGEVRSVDGAPFDRVHVRHTSGMERWYSGKNLRRLVAEPRTCGRTDWRKWVSVAYRTLRAENSTIPDETLDEMRHVLLDNWPCGHCGGERRIETDNAEFSRGAAAPSAGTPG